MKGIELPINVLVIVAVAVIVLLGIIALFMTMFGPSGAEMQLETAWTRGCSKITANCFGYLEADSLDFSSGMTIPLTEDYVDYESKYIGLCLYLGHTGEWDEETKVDAVRECITACGCNI